VARRSRLEKELGKLSEEQMGLARRLRKFLRESDITQEQGVELCELSRSFYKYGVKNPEQSKRAVELGDAPNAPEIYMLMAIGIERARCEHYFDRYYKGSNRG